ncbi:4-hydroxy-2-oxoheptanedioate aldolase [Variovorax sp. J22G21]|uniref:4-hydroxy-2-oxoheptanedioate aldolase n=1 Tax=Variovorax fucosicus TaxID=3053517 RepID=UPI0025770CEC|nr:MULTISPECIES: 4-hydroxy-2-oxoheptanedioate aldolase [unclassified Variovorax]MDM0039002.1 4-hydroxy-2-oxoheptanedioate aldolase [Variovorax sp. J22R193]MDM0063778.1 4-hydroxy-2-oxoheptanedioate aldolase [Variovorax sp. J22G21]
MQTPVNPFKQALREKRAQIGLWLGLADAYSAEICAGAGFDWLLIDGEHSPNGLQSILQQAQAIAAYPGTNAIARVPLGHGDAGTALIKQYLDLGLQTLLVPMVDTAEQAAAIVRAMRYPPQGIRGMGGARASRWGRYANYPKEANDQVCLLLQAETREALANLDAIAATEGVDGIFIGPADLSASLGHVGNPAHAEVQAAIADAIARIQRAGKAAGILTPDETLARKYLDLGATFVAVGLDTNLLIRHTTALAAHFKSGVAAAPVSKTY